MKQKSQCDRILAALQARGEDGVRVDDMTAGTIDDGGPIKSATARLGELRNRGYVIQNRSGTLVLIGKGEPRRPRKRRPKPKPRRPRRVPASRLAELHKMEQGNYGDWYTTRKSFMQLAQRAYELNRKVFWTSVPADERQMVLDEALDAIDALVDLIYRLDTRESDDAIRATMAALTGNTNGRTQAELVTARRLAERKAKRIEVS